MNEGQAPNTIFLKNYQAPSYWVEETKLNFDLTDAFTRVTSHLRMALNKQQHADWVDMVLDGTDLTLEALKLGENDLIEEHYAIQGEQLVIPAKVLSTMVQPDEAGYFELTVITRIKPHENTSLEGLYVSNGMYCTQCEAQGFRKITYYPDRPDVMSRFTTTIVADQKLFPCLLSNGNRMASGAADEGRHWATWEDPFKKPAYLFALVAGDLACQSDTYETASGRSVNIEVYVEPSDLDKVDYAIGALKRSMAWDEKVYGLEYDLSVYMIVAVSHFNMGAMENKGLNIFNTACVLAKPETTTDSRFERVEGVIAHEYFHNWSGNRVTCRDWFQLSLKEGFTVFRDQCFSADMGSEAIKRVEDVKLLRTHQFAEDAGPMAHPVRPDSYIEINNFYTVTVYEKGAEVVRMLHTLLGAEGFRQGSDLYFERHDGQAVTCEDFVSAMAEANAVDLSSFLPWYSQAGTPLVDVDAQYDKDNQTYTLTLRQSLAPSAANETTKPVLIPIKLALFSPEAQMMALTIEGKNLGQETVLRLEKSEQSFVFENVSEKPVPSLLRGFSAPVKLGTYLKPEDQAFLAKHDTDPFNRWEAMHQLICDALLAQVQEIDQGNTPNFPQLVFDSFEVVLNSQFDDLGEQAQLLALPSEAYLSELVQRISVQSIHDSLTALRTALAERFEEHFQSLYERHQSSEPYSPDPAQISQRKIKNLALRYLVASPKTQGQVLAKSQFDQADNMTDQFSALQALVYEQVSSSTEVLDRFYSQWSHESLVVDMWFSAQAVVPNAAVLSHVNQLLEHESFDWKSPNRIRSLIGTFARGNPTQFHQVSGAGYDFLVQMVSKLNATNPQIAARLLGPLTQWRRYDSERQEKMKAALLSLKAEPSLSSDVFEVVTKSLA